MPDSNKLSNLEEPLQAGKPGPKATWSEISLHGCGCVKSKSEESAWLR